MKRPARHQLVFGAVAAALAALAVAAAWPTAPDSPPYRLVDVVPTAGGQRVTVEVDRHPLHDGLREIFAAVRYEHDAEGVYTVHIRCGVDDQGRPDDVLAIGQYAVGDQAEARSSLYNGRTRFTINQDRGCPARGVPAS